MENDLSYMIDNVLKKHGLGSGVMLNVNETTGFQLLSRELFIVMLR